MVFCSVHILPLVSKTQSKLRKEKDPIGAYLYLKASFTCFKKYIRILSYHLFWEKRTNVGNGPGCIFSPWSHQIYIHRAGRPLATSCSYVHPGFPDLWASEEKVLGSSWGTWNFTMPEETVPSLEMKLKTTKETGKCFCLQDAISLVLDQHCVDPAR